MAFTSMADDKELRTLRRVVKSYSGQRQLTERFPPWMPKVGRDGQPIRPNQKPLTYASPIFQEWFWDQMTIQVIRHVHSLFDAYVRGAFSASALRSEVERHEIEVKAGSSVELSTVASRRRQLEALAYTLLTLETT